MPIYMIIMGQGGGLYIYNIMGHDGGMYAYIIMAQVACLYT
jgi:hypothetical protein